MMTKTPSINSHFIGVTPFKEQFKFSISSFEGKIYVYALEKLINMLEDYYYVQKISEDEIITFMLLNSIPCVKYWWDSYWERHVKDDSPKFMIEPTWGDFVDTLKEVLYLMRIMVNFASDEQLCIRR